jgi:hypothetical protein
MPARFFTLQRGNWIERGSVMQYEAPKYTTVRSTYKLMYRTYRAKLELRSTIHPRSYGVLYGVPSYITSLRRHHGVRSPLKLGFLPLKHDSVVLFRITPVSLLCKITLVEYWYVRSSTVHHGGPEVLKYVYPVFPLHTTWQSNCFRKNGRLAKGPDRGFHGVDELPQPQLQVAASNRLL